MNIHKEAPHLIKVFQFQAYESKKLAGKSNEHKKKLKICYLKWEVKKYTGTCEITGYYRE